MRMNRNISSLHLSFFSRRRTVMEGHTIARNDGEKGTALIMALLTMALMLVLTMGISLTAISELGVSNTYTNQTQAFQAAEAGLYHGLDLVRNFTNGTSGDPNFTALLAKRGTVSTDYLSGNNPFTDSSAFASGATMINDDDSNGHKLRDVDGNAIPGAYYRVHVIDDEKSSGAATVKVPNFSPTGTWENDNAVTDTNNRVVFYSTGTYASSSVTLEGWVGFVPYPALVAQKDISVGGSSLIEGAYGGVHSNSNLSIGASAHIFQTATSVGTYTQVGSAQVDGFHAGGQPSLYIPKFVTTASLTSGGPNTTPRIQDYIIRKADTLLIDANYASTNRTGETAQQRVNKLEARLNVTTNSIWNALTTGSGNPNNEQAVTITRDSSGVGTASLVSSLNSTGWRYNSSNGWDIQGSGVDNHTVYIVGLDNYNLSTPSASTPNGGNAKITSNLGSDTNPIHLSVFATGSIEISGTPNFVANLTGLQASQELPPFVTVNLMFVTVEDVKIRGDVEVPRFSGIIYAGEQFDLSGNGAFDGQVIALSNDNVSGSLVSANSISGSFDLSFNGGQAIGTVRLMSWRQIKR
jgi:hypothetical protein